MRSEPVRPSPARLPAPAWAEVDIRHELERRPQRTSALDAEHRAFAALAAEMAANPANMLQKLAEVAVEHPGADTAGVTLLDGDVFRWEAAAGVLASARGGTLPREHHPSGVCIERNTTQLMHQAHRCYPALGSEPCFVESLLIPFHSQGVPIGSVWLVSHNDDRKFDREDERVLSQLSHFAATCWHMRRSAEQLASVNQRKDDFLALLGHELRTPLGAIFAATAVLNTRFAGDALASDATAMIARQSRHLLRLADDVLDIARIEKGKLALNRRRIEAGKVVSESVGALRSRIEERGHSLTLDLGDQAVWLDADPTRLTQVVSNLVENAFKYTPDHGHIAVRLSTEDAHAVLSVRDSGVGILPDQAQQIFEPFLQLHNSSGMASGGIGLGLALVKSLIEMHGGTVMVESGGAGSGSCFSIRLPLLAEVDGEVLVQAKIDRRAES